jgi:hypothetical protein
MDATALDAATLAPVVRRALRRRSAVPLEWRSTPVGYAAFLSGRSIARFDGTAMVGRDRLPWSAILKVVRPPTEETDAGSDPVWDREVRANRSGLLRHLPMGLSAPRLLGIDTDRSGGVGLWLEDVGDAYDGRWPLEQYALAARHLGRLGGAYLTSRDMPRHRWLKRDWAQAHSELERAAEMRSFLTDAAADPRVRRAVGADVGVAAGALLDDQPLFLATLAALPVTLCHHDASTANLFARRLPDGELETVAIDWEDIGPGTVGADLATFVFGTMRRCDFPATAAPVLDRTAFVGYVEGLRDAGWRGDAGIARLGYAAAAALRWSLLAGALRLCADDEASERAERTWRRPAAELRDQWILLARFLLDRADEARSLGRLRRT